MADDVRVRRSSVPSDPSVATEEIAGRHFQLVKFGWGADGIFSAIEDLDGSRLPVDLSDLLSLLPVALTAYGALPTGPSEGTASGTMIVGAQKTDGIDIKGWRNLGILVPLATEGTILSFEVAATLGGTYFPLRDMTDAQVEVPFTAGCAYDIPGELMWARFIKIVTNVVQSGADAVFTIIGRS